MGFSLLAPKMALGCPGETLLDSSQSTRVAKTPLPNLPGSLKTRSQPTRAFTHPRKPSGKALPELLGSLLIPNDLFSPHQGPHPFQKISSLVLEKPLPNPPEASPILKKSLLVLSVSPPVLENLFPICQGPKKPLPNSPDSQKTPSHSTRVFVHPTKPQIRKMPEFTTGAKRF